MEEKGKLESGRGVSPIPLITSQLRETALAALLFVPAGLIEQRVTDSPRGCCPISGLPAPNGGRLDSPCAYSYDSSTFK
ncbi:hypothetical protein PHYPO_G00069730 [Pangasianodon hypophthalmus]|uniref:Uncharacterized protein n=2 Tax=Pangasianodon TaxID=30992 RepID=A0A5N5LVX7_PANHP|nr:hypothetical protein PHYPO_G00069730 [Pangasianodon hypophthalmus]MCI4387335.1 hypothetical protein [Pangasianodon gigas]